MKNINHISSNVNNKFIFRDFIFKTFQKGGVYISLIVLIIVAGILSPNILAPKHLLFILKISSILGIISIGQTLLIISRGIDLSVGASATLIMVLIDAISMGNPKYAFLAIVIAFSVGAFVGIVNGLLVVKFHINPLVGSLGVMTLITGISYLYTKGFAKGTAPEFISYVGNGQIFGFLPVPVVLWVILSIIIFFILRRTTFGRYIFACGANPRSAYLAGIRADRILFYVYIISGLLTAFAAIIWAGYLRTPTLVGGEYYPLDSLAAVIIGGTTFAGGKGSINGTIIGTIIIVLLSSLLNMIGLGQAGKFIFQGFMILLMVFVYTGRKRIN
ncbi:MAG: ABC transporter permease [Candidatus Humimicrobiaceae bacterium]